MHNPFFSIIIPTYNRAHLIERTLESIRAQDFKDYEVIIVDDGSTDNSEEVIQQYIDLHQIADQWRYFKKENAERAAARNYGTHQSSGKYLNWFDSDDIALPNHLESAHDSLKDEAKEVIHLSYQLTSPEGQLLDTRNNLPPLVNERLINGNILSCNGVFVRKDIALTNLFNEDRALSASEDYELWLRLAAQYDFHHINQITSVIIQHEQRSVNSMSDKQKLIERFTRFIKYTTENNDVRLYFGKKGKYFIMKNYLLLAVELAVNNHKKASLKYLKCAFQNSVMVFSQRTFYATLKHLLLN